MPNSERLKLPFLAIAQAQKEMTHNEALALLDVAVQPVVQSVAPADIPVAPALGQCWIVGPAPADAWSGHAGALASWTAGGWRFLAAFEGMSAWSVADEAIARRSSGAWLVGRMTAANLAISGVQVVGPRRPAIAPPTGGASIDIAARVTIAAILETLVAHGLIN
jgi:hypothetical protein